jgi:transcriptional regulator with XRE-family HTH domain
MPKSPREKFSENLRRIRRERGISQAEVGCLAEMHRTEISLLERGLREPWLGTLIRLSAVLEAPLGEFFEGIEWVPLVPEATTTPGRFVVAPVRDDPATATPTAAQLDEWLDRR